MRIQHQFLQAVLAGFLMVAFADNMQAQQQSPQPDDTTLSTSLHTALYPEVVCAHCIVPQWDRGYIVHREFDKDPSMVTMYDRNGKKVLEAHLEPQGFAKVSLRAAGATQTGVILAVGAGTLTDGSIQGFIAKTDGAGRTLQSVHTGRYSPHQVCEATDGTVWTLGYNLDYHDSTDEDKNVLRHYSFAKGLLESLVALDSISKSRDAMLNVSSPGKSFLRCGRNRISVFFASSAQYVEVDMSSNAKLASWNVALPPIAGGKVNGFAVTEAGRIFVSFFGFSENNVTHGLYELKANAGTSVATLVPVNGTITTHDRDSIPPDQTFDRLWGADGDELVVHRYGDGSGISWAKFSTSQTTPD